MLFFVGVCLCDACPTVQARRALDEVGELLRQKQLEYKERMRVCDEREATLTMRQEQTRESVTKFAKFMKENDAKRARALKRAADEAMRKRVKEAESKRDKLRFDAELGAFGGRNRSADRKPYEGRPQSDELSGLEVDKRFKATYRKGGSVKSSASSRADGIAQRGKTRGKFI